MIRLIATEAGADTTAGIVGIVGMLIIAGTSATTHLLLVEVHTFM